ncbi:MAG: DUF3099 domain-containing protein [Lacisediminihabitans sp.]
MVKQQSITSLPRSPDDDRHRRMVKYVIAMSIRLVCIGLCLVTQGWWLLVCAIGAVLLPYIAVVLANNAGRPRDAAVICPGGIVPVAPRDPGTGDQV